MPKNSKLSYVRSVKTNSKNVIDFQKYLYKLSENYYTQFDKHCFLDKLIAWNDIWIARQNGYQWCSLCKDKGEITNTRGITTNCPRCNYKNNMMNLKSSSIKEIARWYKYGRIENLELRLSAGNLCIIRGEDILLILGTTNDVSLCSMIDKNKVYCIYYDVLPSEKYKTYIDNYEDGDFDINLEMQKGTFFPNPITELIIFEMILKNGES